MHRPLTLLLLLLLALLARTAAGGPRSLTGAYSDYEQQAIRDAQAWLGGALDPAPEGKVIERIELVRLDPIDAHDGLPTAIPRSKASSGSSRRASSSAGSSSMSRRSTVIRIT